MQINLKTTAENQEVVKELTRKLPSGTKENVVARLAIGYSIASGTKFLTSDMKDSKGKEYKDHILFEEKYRDFYIALISQHYGVYRTNEEIPKLFKMHLDHGLEEISKLFEYNENYSMTEFLLENIGKGIESLENVEVSLDAVANSNQNIEKSSFSRPIKVKIGGHVDSKEPIYYTFNDVAKYNNQHIAVAGASGTGKTQFALEFLKQVCEQSNGQVNFVYLDFKGLKKEDLPRLEPFFKATKAEFIDAPEKPFPLNPLMFIDNVNQKNKIVGINKFVDIISKYSNIGKKQQQYLKDATREAFDDAKLGEHPSLQDIYENVLEKYDDKRDTLTEILERLSEYELFANKVKNPNAFLNSNYYLSLSGELDNAVRFTSVFLIINYLFNVFSNMGGSDVVDGHREMRYILLIDEAHDLFRDKKSLEILEVVLRKIRSYGVSVFLLSQGIEEYNQPNFDFSQECETSILLRISDLTNSRLINKFMGYSTKEGVRALRNLEKIDTGQAITNIKEFERGALFGLRQFKDNN
ncbi:MAG: DndE family protein [Flavobacteriales bacterium]|nr:DndE family protein [Flavobacteriales bacterium]